MRVLKAASAGLAEVRNFLPRLWTLTRQLFNEVMGLVFIALSLFFLVGAHGFIQVFRRLEEHPDEFPKLLFSGFFFLMFAAFAVSSFLRARKLSRSSRQE